MPEPLSLRASDEDRKAVKEHLQFACRTAVTDMRGELARVAFFVRIA